MKTFIDTNALEFIETTHGKGLKKVFMESSDSSTMLTQFAYGKLSAGEQVPEHRHDTMEEVFYFLAGEGTYVVDYQHWHVSPGVVIRVTAGTPHSLITTGTRALEFLYFGIGTTDRL